MRTIIQTRQLTLFQQFLRPLHILGIKPFESKRNEHSIDFGQRHMSQVDRIHHIDVIVGPDETSGHFGRFHSHFQLGQRINLCIVRDAIVLNEGNLFAEPIFTVTDYHHIDAEAYILLPGTQCKKQFLALCKLLAIRNNHCHMVLNRPRRRQFLHRIHRLIDGLHILLFHTLFYQFQFYGHILGLSCFLFCCHNLKFLIRYKNIVST